MNISNPDTLKIVLKVCQALCSNNSFPGFDKDDIHQEAFLICTEILDKYDGSFPLEHFLMTSVRNRLLNFKRKNLPYYKFKCSICNNKNSENCEDCVKNRTSYSAKKNLDSPINLDEVKDEILDYRGCNGLEKSELFYLLDLNLPISMREDYLKMLSDVPVKKFRREEIISRIQDILIQNDYIDGENNG